VCDWITEKSEKLEMDDLAKDLTTVKALQRKHKGIERELAPIKDKVRVVTRRSSWTNLTTVKALQRRHKIIERELAPT
jgi:hypothetical protein